MTNETNPIEDLILAIAWTKGPRQEKIQLPEPDGHGGPVYQFKNIFFHENLNQQEG